MSPPGSRQNAPSPLDLSIDILGCEPEESTSPKGLRMETSTPAATPRPYWADIHDVSTDEEEPRSPSAPKPGVPESCYDPFDEEELLAGNHRDPPNPRISPSFLPDLATQVRALTHREARNCPFVGGFSDHGCTVIGTGITDFPKQVDASSQTTEGPTTIQAATQTPPAGSATEISTQTDLGPATVVPPRPNGEHAQVTANTPSVASTSMISGSANTLDPGADPSRLGPRYGQCFNCRALDHVRDKCPSPHAAHCDRCGYPGVTIRTCPIHGAKWRQQGPYVPHSKRNVPHHIAWERPTPRPTEMRKPHQREEP